VLFSVRTQTVNDIFNSTEVRQIVRSHLYDISKEYTTPSTFKQTVMSGEDCVIDQSGESQLDIKLVTDMTPGTSNYLMNSVETRVDINTATIADNQDFYNTFDDTNGEMAVISFCIRRDFESVEYLMSDGQITTGSITNCCWIGMIMSMIAAIMGVVHLV